MPTKKYPMRCPPRPLLNFLHCCCFSSFGHPRLFFDGAAGHSRRSAESTPAPPRSAPCTRRQARGAVAAAHSLVARLLGPRRMPAATGGRWRRRGHCCCCFGGRFCFACCCYHQWRPRRADNKGPACCGPALCCCRGRGARMPRRPSMQQHAAQPLVASE